MVGEFTSGDLQSVCRWWINVWQIKAPCWDPVSQAEICFMHITLFLIHPCWKQGDLSGGQKSPSCPKTLPSTIIELHWWWSHISALWEIKVISGTLWDDKNSALFFWSGAKFQEFRILHFEITIKEFPEMFWLLGSFYRFNRWAS